MLLHLSRKRSYMWVHFSRDVPSSLAVLGFLIILTRQIYWEYVLYFENLSGFCLFWRNYENQRNPVLMCLTWLALPFLARCETQYFWTQTSIVHLTVFCFCFLIFFFFEKQICWFVFIRIPLLLVLASLKYFLCPGNSNVFFFFLFLLLCFPLQLVSRSRVEIVREIYFFYIGVLGVEVCGR